MLNRRVHHLLICMIAFVLIGCWDETNIEDRGFIVGFAIDLAGENEKGNPELTLTNQLIIPAGIGSPSDGSGNSEKAFMNISATGDSIFAIDNEIRMSESKLSFFEHAMVIVVSEDVLEVPHLFPNIMDLFFRSNSIRRGTKVIVAKGEAKEILEVTPENEKVPAIYLDRLLETNTTYTGGFHLIRLGEIHEHFLMTDSFIIPRFIPSEKKVDFDAEIAFNGEEGKVIGTLNDKEIKGFHLLMDTYIRGPIEFDYDGDLVTYDIEEANSKITMDVKNPENISVSVDINAEGRIVEVFGTQAITDPKTLRAIEKKASEKIEEIVNMAIEQAQKELRTDIFGLKRKLQQRHYDTWKKVKDNWDSGENYFSTSTFHVKAKVKIRAVGDTKKSHKSQEEE